MLNCIRKNRRYVWRASPSRLLPVEISGRGWLFQRPMGGAFWRGATYHAGKGDGLTPVIAELNARSSCCVWIGGSGVCLGITCPVGVDVGDSISDSFTYVAARLLHRGNWCGRRGQGSTPCASGPPAQNTSPYPSLLPSKKQNWVCENVCGGLPTFGHKRNAEWKRREGKSGDRESLNRKGGYEQRKQKR